MIQVSNRNDWSIVTIDGELNSVNAPDADVRISGALANSANLIFDFSKLEYISSAGLRSLLLGAKQIRERNGKMAIAGASERIRKVFQLSGLIRHLNCFETLEEAEKFIQG
ncbi:MAG: STAS domain-containing protein [Lentisphaeria bacterium]|nr:STAS domain-containing protein [Lentisphaeria bacterium]